MQRTRRQILDCLKLRGPMNVDMLGEELGVMPVTIRAHINILERDQLLEGAERRTGKAGRPCIVYSLTEKAQELFPNNYDNLAASLLENVRRLHGSKVMLQVVEKMGEEMADLHRQRLNGKHMDKKVEMATEILNEEGCLATWEKKGNKYIVKAHNCPYLHVAEHRPEICSMEVAFLRKALSKDVKLEDSVLTGKTTCIFSFNGG